MPHVFGRPQRLISVLLLIILTGLVAAQPAPAGRSPVGLTPDDLLAALDWNAVRAQAPEGARWWPSFPQFNAGIGDRAPGMRFYVVQPMASVDAAGRIADRIDATVLLYDNPAAAMRDFTGRLLAGNDKGVELVDGPPVADRSRYFTRTSDRYSEPVALPNEATVRFVVGPFVARVSVFKGSEHGSEKPEVLALYARVVAARARQLLAGGLKATPLPGRLEALMPPQPAASAVGRVLGSAVLPPESWALEDTSGDPVKTLAALKRGGVDTLGFRRYALAAESNHVIEVTLFVFARPEHAAQWQRGFMRDATANKWLNPGKTGTISGFTVKKNGIYELEFARGQIVGDVFCESPFGREMVRGAACRAMI